MGTALHSAELATDCLRAILTMDKDAQTQADAGGKT
ncbi:hypothetical protein J2X52_001818 [Luteimonas sp. 3794]|nr:hypothetical protein [Luteimonas sp. 3794]